MSLLLRIVAPHFVAGLILDGGKVVFTAPILGYMNGWTQQKMLKFVHGKGWDIDVCEPPPRTPRFYDSTGQLERREA